MKQTLQKFIRKPLLAALIMAPAAAMAEGDAVIVLAKDGTSFEVGIPQVERIEFGSSQLSVKTRSAETTSFDYSDIDRMLIGAKRQGIAKLATDGNIAVWPTMTESAVNVAGAAKGAQVRIYTASGALVASATCADGTATLDISAAPAGVCIVAIGNKSVKIIKK